MNEPTDDKSTKADDRRFADEAKSLFDDSVARLDSATLSQLNQRRQAALAKAAARQPSQVWLRWMPASGLAAAAVVAVMMMGGPDNGNIPEFPDTAATDFEILLGDDSLEMIEELEFYSWIDMADLDTPDNVG